MIKIEFAKPMITSVSACLDMTTAQAKNARKLFSYAMAVGKDGALVEGKDATEGCLFGCEAVLAYMESLGLKGTPMKRIPVHAMLELATTFDEAYDLLFLMRRVKSRNDRVNKLTELGAPAIILHNEQRLLWEAVEALFFNRFLDHPVTFTCEPEEEDEEPEVHIRTCLMDLIMKNVEEEA